MVKAARFAGFGQTVFAEMSALAAARGAINLGQGFPDFDGPAFVREAAIAAIAAGHGQYAPTAGVPDLAGAIAGRFSARTGIAVDPGAEVTVTSGCTEALASAFLGLVDPGDEVILFEPYFDSYPACAAMAGAVPRYVTLTPPGFRIEREAVAAAITGRTRAVLLNTPHNPTGRVFDLAELEAVAALCREHDLLLITDEVYEDLVFEGIHHSPAAMDGMWERTLSLSSLGKSFSLTGWKVGWGIGPPSLTEGLRAAHQFVTFATATPLQHGAAAALRAGDDYYREFVAGYRRRRDLVVSGLADLGFEVYRPQGTYFVLADHTPFGVGDDVAFARFLIEEAGVAAIPPGAFYHRPGDGARLIRFAFCKEMATLEAALDRLQVLRRFRPDGR